MSIPRKPKGALKRCGAKVGTCCPCRQEHNTWRRGDPFAELHTAEAWVPRTRDKS